MLEVWKYINIQKYFVRSIVVHNIQNVLFKKLVYARSVVVHFTEWYNKVLVDPRYYFVKLSNKQ